jgi:hypothetical protein
VLLLRVLLLLLLLLVQLLVLQMRVLVLVLVMPERVQLAAAGLRPHDFQDGALEAVGHRLHPFFCM